MTQRRLHPLAGLLGGVLSLVITFGAHAGPKVYVGNFKDNTVSVIDAGTAAVIATVPVSAGPHGMTATPDGRTVFVAGDGSSTVSAIDTATDRVVKTIEVGKTPHGLAMLPDGKLLLAAVYGEDRIAFVDTATRSAIASVPVAKPHTLAVRPDGKLAYVASQEPGKFALVVIDIDARTVLRSVPLDKPPRDPEFAPDGKSLYFTLAGVNALNVLDPATDEVVAEIPTGASPHIGGVFRNASVGTVVVQGPGEIQLFNPATNRPVRTIAVGKQPHWMAPSADGKTLYVTNEGSNEVTIIDLATAQTRSVAVGNAPRKVVVPNVAAASMGAKVSIANFTFVPATTTIAAGESVTWTNDDGAPHGLAYADGSKGTDLLLPGASFSRSFDKQGTYAYVCAVHPYMQGTVVVR